MDEKIITACWNDWLRKLNTKCVALYGAGEHTIMLEKLLTDSFYQMPIVCIIDSDPRCSELLGYPIVSREHINLLNIDAVIVSSKSSEQEIVESLKYDFPVDNIYRFYNFSHQQIFNKIHHENHWGDECSVSGPGSTASQTTKIVEQLPILFDKLSINKVLDIPCGDFNWMKLVIKNISEEKFKYHGGDIVDKLIKNNKKLYQSSSTKFNLLDILSSALPKMDAVLCRDCLVHFSNDDIRTALENIVKSGSDYLITTTFMERVINENISTGSWRPLNLCAEPFNFPKPSKFIIEECSENDGIYHDKALAVWKIADISPFIFGDKI